MLILQCLNVLEIVLVLQCLNVLELACAFTLYKHVSYIAMMQTTEPYLISEVSWDKMPFD